MGMLTSDIHDVCNPTYTLPAGAWPIKRSSEAALCCCPVCLGIKARLNMAMPLAPYLLDVFRGQPRRLQEAGGDKQDDISKTEGDSPRLVGSNIKEWQMHGRGRTHAA
jgi:hypothetical protein